MPRNADAPEDIREDSEAQASAFDSRPSLASKRKGRSGCTDAAYPGQRHPWLGLAKGDPCLYVDFYRDGATEYGDWNTRFGTRGGPPAVSVRADISGRQNGWPEARELAVLLLSRFSGVAEDDLAERFWSREEIEQDRVVNGKKFGYWRGTGSVAETG